MFPSAWKINVVPPLDNHRVHNLFFEIGIYIRKRNVPKSANMLEKLKEDSCMLTDGFSTPALYEPTHNFLLLETLVHVYVLRNEMSYFYLVCVEVCK